MRADELDNLSDDARVRVHSFIKRCFVNRADKDYLTARLCYQNLLMENFLWSSQQCLEKYLKAILLYSGDKADMGHDLHRAYKRLFHDGRKFVFDKFPKSTFPNDVGSETLEEFLKRISDIGNNRYGTASYATRGDELYKLDGAVFELRRYCQFGKWKVNDKDLTGQYRQAIHEYKMFRVDAYLENVLKAGSQNKEQQKQILQWHNYFFGEKDFSEFKYDENPWLSNAENSDLSTIYEYAAQSTTPDNKKHFIEVGNYLLNKVQFSKAEETELREIISDFLYSIVDYYERDVAQAPPPLCTATVDTP